MGAGMDLARTTAIAAVAYFSMGTVVLGESPAKWALSKRQSMLDGLAQGRAAVASALGHGADAISGVLDGDTPEPVEEAHLRVRVKAS